MLTEPLHGWDAQDATAAATSIPLPDSSRLSHAPPLGESRQFVGGNDPSTEVNRV